MSPAAEVLGEEDIYVNTIMILGSTLTGLLMRFRHVSGRKLPLAAGNTPISCSSGLNCTNIQIRSRVLTSDGPSEQVTGTDRYQTESSHPLPFIPPFCV